MIVIIRSIFILMLATLLITGCSSDPAPKRDPYNDADSQRSRSGQAQSEMSKDTSK